MRSFLLVLLLALGCSSAQKPKTSPHATAHVQRGAEALAAEDLDRAEAEFHLALEYEPLPQAMNGLGLVALARDDLATARDWFAAAVRKQDDFVEGHANLGATELRMGHPELALPHFQSALAIDPGYTPARHNLARTLFRLGRHDEAREELMKLTSSDPENADAWAELGVVELARGQVAAAGRAVARALELEPRHVTARRVRASLLRDAGDLPGALEAYELLVREAPHDADLLIDRGVTFLLAGQAEAALRDADRAVALAPEKPTAHLVRGAALLELGRRTDAIAAFEQAIALAESMGRDFPQARELLASAQAMR